MKNNIKNKKGITLIALVITIIVLLILAGISISMISSQDGILNKATKAKESQKEASEKEELTLIAQSAIIEGEGKIDNEETLKKELDSNKFTYKGNGIIETKEGKSYVVFENGKVEEAVKIESLIGENTKNVERNTVVLDEYENIFVVPQGFKIVTDDTTGNAKNVTQGIVIEDVTAGNKVVDGVTVNPTKGSQFVWVPVGEIYTNKERTEKEEIELARYSFYNNGTIASKKKNAKDGIGNFTDEDILDTTFVKSANENHGYYIGRYEAGDATATEENASRTEQSGINGTLVSKANQKVYNYINREDSKEKSKNMYENKTFKSELINSFAWDTAIVFEQKFDDRAEEKKEKLYSIQNSLNKYLQKTGQSGDIICNIYDMASNILEWSTETYKNTIPTYRGGYYVEKETSTNVRYGNERSGIYLEVITFRVILYL